MPEFFPVSRGHIFLVLKIRWRHQIFWWKPNYFMVS